MTCARLAVTPGEPAGVGPELLIQLVQSGYPHQLVAFADPQLLAQRARQLGLPLSLHSYQPDATPRPTRPAELTVANIPLFTHSKAGKLDIANSSYVLETLNQATDACLLGNCQALITGPVHKGIINDAGVPFSGHTEYLAERSGVPRVVMMLATEGLRVALATTHLPLRDVADHITQSSLQEVIGILHEDLQRKFGIANPHILVAGLNPHAGEGGHLGSEERDVIEPVLTQCRQQGMALQGPLPADTLFTDKYLQHADAVLAMYHDQGLPVLKYKGFGRAVNITLGLPFIRTSVDHGTALDLAGTGQASITSLVTALDYAADMIEISRSKP